MLTVAGLSKSFGGRDLFDDVSFTIQSGERIAITGPNGAGKTTTITKLIHYLLYKNYINSVVFTAPTNKAVNVIKSKFRNDLDDLITKKLKCAVNNNESFNDMMDKLEEKGFKVHFLTVHKLLNYKILNYKIIFSIGTTKIPSAPACFNCSMISQKSDSAITLCTLLHPSFAKGSTVGLFMPGNNEIIVSILSLGAFNKTYLFFFAFLTDSILKSKRASVFSASEESPFCLIKTA